MNKQILTLSELNNRSRDIFKSLVDAYLETGDPVGSKTLSRLLDFPLSSATIRSVMSDLESAGLLSSPHTSAGRVPTERGLKLFVDGFLEIGALEKDERHAIEAHCRTAGINIETMLTQASTMLSGLSKCAGVVIAPKTEAPLKHIEFVHLGADRALVVMVTAGGAVQDRRLRQGRFPEYSAGDAAGRFDRSDKLFERASARPDAGRSAGRDLKRDRTASGTVGRSIFPSG